MVYLQGSEDYYRLLHHYCKCHRTMANVRNNPNRHSYSTLDYVVTIYNGVLVI